MPFEIITIGSATRDVFLFTEALHAHKAKDAPAHVEACLPFGAKITIEQIHYDTGGGGTNAAVTFARLGKFKTAALIRIGADSRGRSVLNALQTDQVDTSFTQTTPDEYTAYSAILSPAHNGGERTILVYRGASSHIEQNKIPWKKLQAKWFYVSSLGGDLVLFKKILAHAEKIGAQVAWNPGGQELAQLSKDVRPPSDRRSDLPIFNLLTFLILNREESSRLTGVRFEDTKGLLRALARITPAAVMTDGPKGAYAVTSPLRHSERSEESRTNVRQHAYYTPSAGSKPKNLTGAGDAFGSGFVTGWIKSRGDIKYALRLASFNADSVVQHIGAKVGILKSYPPFALLSKLPVREMKL